MKDTQELLKLLESTDNINVYLETESASMTTLPLHELLEQLRIHKKLKKSQCILDANINREYGYQIFSGAKTPSRDKVLSLCLAMHLSRKESNLLLRAAGYNDLYSKNKRDSVVIFALTKNLSVIDTNLLLDQLNEKTI